VTLVKAKKAYFDEEKYDKSSSELINRKYCNLHNYFNDSRNQEILKCVFKQNHIVCWFSGVAKGGWQKQNDLINNNLIL